MYTFNTIIIVNKAIFRNFNVNSTPFLINLLTGFAVEISIFYTQNIILDMCIQSHTAFVIYSDNSLLICTLFQGQLFCFKFTLNAKKTYKIWQ